MTVFNPLTHPGLFSTSTTAAERLWEADKTAAVLKSMGILDVTISNTAPADTTVIWLDPDDTNSAPGTVKVHDGTTWVTITPDAMLRYLVNKASAAGIQAIASELVGDATAKATLDAGIAGTGPLTGEAIGSYVYATSISAPVIGTTDTAIGRNGANTIYSTVASGTPGTWISRGSTGGTGGVWQRIA